jgi:hypothetical protein
LYLAKRLAPIPLPPRSKDPGYPGWADLRLTRDAFDQHFPPQQARNVGVLNGAPSENIRDVDRDCPEALRAALLPPTGWLFGCEFALRSRWIYKADSPRDAAQEKFTDLDGGVLVELRGTGGPTVYPPPTHKDPGERIIWERFADPASMTLAEAWLKQAMRGGMAPLLAPVPVEVEVKVAQTSGGNGIMPVLSLTIPTWQRAQVNGLYIELRTEWERLKKVGHALIDTYGRLAATPLLTGKQRVCLVLTLAPRVNWREGDLAAVILEKRINAIA